MLTLASGRRRVDVTVTMPDGYDTGEGVFEVTLADLGTLIANTIDQINKPDLNLSADDSDTVPDAPLSTIGNAVTFGASNYSGSITVLRSLVEATGLPDPTTDTLYAAIGEKGARAWYIDRIGPLATVALATGHEGWIYEAISDEPKTPQEVSGYVKEVIKLGIQTRRRFKIVAGA